MKKRTHLFRKPGSEKIEAMLNLIEERCDPHYYFGRCAPFIIDCLTVIEHRLPPVALAALETAKHHQTGRSSLQSVSNANALCWEDLRGREMLLEDPAVSATRAVICLLGRQLHPASDDLLDSLSFCLNLLNNVEKHFGEQELLLNKYFEDCLR